MSNLASDDFTGSNGDPLSSLWANGLLPTGASREIQDNRARFTTGSAAGTYNSANRVSALVDITPPVNAVALFSFIWPTITRAFPRFYLRSVNTTIDAKGGYRISIDPDSDFWNIGYGTNFGTPPFGTFPTNTAADNVALTWVAGTKYWCRFGVVDDEIKARIWEDGDPEPSGWQREGTDTTFTTAESGLGLTIGPGATSGGLETFDIDDFSLDSTWPAVGEAFPLGVLPLTVELELDSTWTDITSYVYGRDSVEITRGSADESRSLEPSRCRMTLNNRDGRFSPRNPTGTYFGLLGRNTPLRVSIESDRSWLPMAENTGTTESIYATTPDAAALDITGDFDLRFEADLDSWYDPFELVTKWNSGANQRAYAMYVVVTGYLAMYSSVDGTISGTSNHQSTVRLPTMYGHQAVRVTFDVNNGAGGNTATFYTAPSLAGPWVQLGDPVVGASTTSVFASTAVLRVGPNPDAGFVGTNVRGKIYGAQVLDGIAGTVVANPDFTLLDEGDTSFADSAGLTWTLTGTSATLRDYRFTGEVTAWPQKWDTTGTDIYTEIEASGITRRLGQGSSPVPSSIYRSISADPLLVAYWPAEDGDQATRLGSALSDGKAMSITGTPALASDTTWVASNALPMLSLAKFRGSITPYTPTDSVQVRCYISVPEAGIANGILLFTVTCSGTGRTWSLKYTTGGGLAVDGYNNEGVNVLTSAATAFAINGRPFYAALRLTDNGTGVDAEIGAIYADAGSGFFSSVTFNVAGVQIGRATVLTINPELRADEVVMGHFSVTTDTAFSTGDLASSVVAWAGEPAGARIKRLCGENDIPVFQVASVDESELMGPQKIDTALNLIKEAADSDLGILYEPRDNYGLKYRPRKTLNNQSARLTVSYSSSEMTSFQPVEDDQSVINDVTVTRADGGSSRAVDTTSALSISAPPDGIGQYDTALTLSLFADSQTDDQAGWRLHLGTIDEARYPIISFDLASPSFLSGDELTFHLSALDIGDRLVVTDIPTWLPPEDVQQIAQGFTESLGNFERRISVNCTPASPWEIARYAEDTDDTLDQYKYSSDGTVTAEEMDTTETGMDVTTASGPVWTTDAAQLPFDLMVGGERMTATAVSGTSANQTFTVTRSVNGVVKSHATGTAVTLFRPAVYGF